MNGEFTPTLYMRLRKTFSAAPGQTVTLGHLAQLLAEPEMEAQLRDLPICKPSAKDGNVILLDMMQIVAHIRKLHPHIQVEYFGEPHVLIAIQEPKMKRPNYPMLLVACLLLFIGSGLAIMNFHVDVSMLEVHQRLYEMITGTWSDHPYWLQIPYSIGLGAGMVLFFNQLFQKRFNEEPSPLEVEMFSYQESLNHYMVTEEYDKLNKHAMTCMEAADAPSTMKPEQGQQP